MSLNGNEGPSDAFGSVKLSDEEDPDVEAFFAEAGQMINQLKSIFINQNESTTIELDEDEVVNQFYAEADKMVKQLKALFMNQNKPIVENDEEQTSSKNEKSTQTDETTESSPTHP